MTGTGDRLRSLLSGPEVVVLPCCYDALSARIAEHSGANAVMVAGFDVGAALCVTEPLLTSTEMLMVSNYVVAAVEIPVIVDLGAGYGEPVHVNRVVTDFRRAGLAGITIEDQAFPKRAHYHRDYQEHLIDLDSMLRKLEWARRAAGDEMVLVGRTDTYQTGTEEEAIGRCRAFFEAGADAVMAFPRTEAQVERLAKELPGPLIYANVRGNRVGRPILDPAEAQRLGCGALIEGHQQLFRAVAAMIEPGETNQLSDDNEQKSLDSDVATLNQLNLILRMQALWSIEEDTVET
jgi:2-methylisocitrate lyase-like PEP mutase family enzyme